MNVADEGGAIYNSSAPAVGITNCVFWGNTAGSGAEIHNFDSTLTVGHCDIQGGWNGAGVYNDGSSTNIDGGGNIDSDPLFADVETGTWTSNATCNASTYQSTLTNNSASWTANELAGKFINPDTSQVLHYLIVSNDTHTVTVWGDLSSMPLSGATYQIFDYHLKSVTGRWTPLGWTNDTVTSPCIDAGDPGSEYAYEPIPNGGTINMGAYGNTPEASKSPVTLTVFSEYGGADPAVGAHSYTSGTVVTCLVTNSPVHEGAPATQYVCIGWTGSGSVPPDNGTTNTGPFNITGNSTIAWTWQTNYWLDVTDGGVSGGVSVADGWFLAGTNLSILGTPSNGYHFVNWTGDIATNANPLSLVMDQRYTLTANFDINVYSITATAGLHGAISPSGAVQVAHGFGTNFFITPDAHYHVADVEVDSASIGPTNFYTFDNVTTDHTIHASFAIDTHTLEVISAHGGADPAVGTHTNDYGTDLTCRVTNSAVYDGVLATQYLCTGWALTGHTDTNGLSAGTGTNVVMVHTNDAVLTWQWQTNYWLDVTDGGVSGGVSVADGWFLAGTNVSILAVASNGYELAYWSGDVPPANTNDDPLELVMDRPRAVTANFRVASGPRYWDAGGTDSNWSTAANWTFDTEPALSEDAHIGHTGYVADARAVIAQPGEACHDLYVGLCEGATGRVTMTGGELDVGGSLLVGMGSFTQQPGTEVSIAGDLVAGGTNGLSGTYSVNGAGLTVTGGLQVGLYPGSMSTFESWGANVCLAFGGGTSHVGRAGYGRYLQYGGTNDIMGVLILGALTNGCGELWLEEAEMMVGLLVLGVEGLAVCGQDGDTVLTAGEILMGAGSGGMGEYSLTGGDI